MVVRVVYCYYYHNDYHDDVDDYCCYRFLDLFSATECFLKNVDFVMVLNVLLLPTLQDQFLTCDLDPGFSTLSALSRTALPPYHAV